MVETKKFLMASCGQVLRDDNKFFIIRLKEPMSAKKLKQIKNSDTIKVEVAEDILNKNRKETPLAKEVREIFKEASLLIRSLERM